jgi:hypothetical protein
MFVLVLVICRASVATFGGDPLLRRAGLAMRCCNHQRSPVTFGEDSPSQEDTMSSQYQM